MVLGLQHWAQAAQKITRRAAAVKPWRVRTKAAKAMLQRAQELAAGRGYIIATDAEIFAEFSEFYPVLKWAKLVLLCLVWFVFVKIILKIES